MVAIFTKTSSYKVRKEERKLRKMKEKQGRGRGVGANRMFD